MPVKRKVAKLRRPNMPPEFWALLNDAPLPAGSSGFRAFDFNRSAEALWKAHGADVLPRWILRKPGTRPTCWWRFQAPTAARARVGGTGQAAEDDSVNDVRRFPALWSSVDPNAPPTFEAEAAYLKRLGLLLPDEARRLREKDFVAVALPTTLWPPAYLNDGSEK